MHATPEAIARASDLMLGFAARSGLSSDRPPQRYLWTDAFAVCNFLGLHRATGQQRYLALARALVDQVHRVLGRHRPDDPRQGWLSGLGEAEAAEHPTRGGLRIGKVLPERAAGAPFDARLEWDRDGQYFHYLTRWMHALDQVARTTGEPRYNRWARELAEAAHAAFVVGAARRQMVWKRSCDLSRVLVPSMGQHDPLDGLVTCIQLERTAADLPGGQGAPHLARAAADYAAMVDGAALDTTDPLGLGGLLADAAKVAQLTAGPLLAQLLTTAAEGVAAYVRAGEWRGPASTRLPFRELGLAIGLSALALVPDGVAPAAQKVLAACAFLADALAVFWLDPAHQRAPTWAEHLDINEVMLATALAPAGAVVLLPAHPQALHPPSP